jgi:hypothetical protein
MLELVRPLGVVVLMLIGPAVAVGFLLLRKRQVTQAEQYAVDGRPSSSAGAQPVEAN